MSDNFSIKARNKHVRDVIGFPDARCSAAHSASRFMGSKHFLIALVSTLLTHRNQAWPSETACIRNVAPLQLFETERQHRPCIPRTERIQNSKRFYVQHFTSVANRDDRDDRDVDTREFHFTLPLGRKSPMTPAASGPNCAALCSAVAATAESMGMKRRQPWIYAEIAESHPSGGVWIEVL